MKKKLTRNFFCVAMSAVLMFSATVKSEASETIGTNGAVSSSTESASQVGVDILKKGGNAVDAAVATIFAIGVTEPSYSGIGGSGIMNIYLKEENKSIILEYMETVPANVKPGWYNPKTDKNTAKNVVVPGQVYALLDALSKYGTMSRQEAMKPAIDLANNGFTVNKQLASAINSAMSVLGNNEEFLSIYTNNGVPLKEGEIAENKLLGNTLKRISDGGINEFYEGDLAKEMIQGLNDGGSLMTIQDLKDYRSIERKALTTNYMGYDVIVPPPPSNGGDWLLEMLNILENYDIGNMSPDSFEYISVFNEACRLAMADAFAYIGDPAYFDLPTDKMISKEYAAERKNLISAQKAMINPPAGKLTSKPINPTGTDSKDTSHIAVMDGYGNVVSTTNTLGNLWGSKVLAPGLGFFYNSHMGNLEHDPDKSDSSDYVLPGKRVRSTVSPTIILKENEPVMAIGSPGNSSIPPAIASVINNVLIYKMDLQTAIDQPRAFVLDLYDPIMTIENNMFSNETRVDLEEYGYKLNNVGDYSASLGGIAAIYYDKDKKVYYGGADPRRDYKTIPCNLDEQEELIPAA